MTVFDDLFGCRMNGDLSRFVGKHVRVYSVNCKLPFSVEGIFEGVKDDQFKIRQLSCMIFHVLPSYRIVEVA